MWIGGSAGFPGSNSTQMFSGSPKIGFCGGREAAIVQNILDEAICRSLPPVQNSGPSIPARLAFGT